MIRHLLLAALLIPAAATAQETKTSANAKLDAEFAASDRNGDGFLSPVELEARMRKMKLSGGKTLDAVHAKRVAGLFLARGDANKDGRISKAESRALMGQVFARYDTNGDGKVEGAEAATARAAARSKAAGR